MSKEEQEQDALIQDLLYRYSLNLWLFLASCYQSWVQAFPSEHLVAFGSKCLSGLSAASWDLVAASMAFSQECCLSVRLLLAVKRIPLFCLASPGSLLRLLSLLPLSIHLQGVLQVGGCRALAEEFEGNCLWTVPWDCK